MSTIRSSEDPAVRFAKLFGKLYYYMAEAIVEKLGEEEGAKVISKALHNFAAERVRSMKEEAAERGINPVGEEAFYAVRDMPFNGWKRSERGGEYCPFHDVWSDFGEKGMKLGKLYCEVDFPLFNSFGISLERNHCLTDGDDFCEFITGELK